MRLHVTLLTAGALLMALGAQAQDRPAEHEQAIAAIRKLGGQVQVDAMRPGAPVAVVLIGSDRPADCVLHLKDLVNLQTCDL
jgi:hypothetical protein